MCFREINNKEIINYTYILYLLHIHTSIFYCRNYWWIWLGWIGIDMLRPWFKDTLLSQLTRGNYYFARNQFEHEKWSRSRTRSIPNNYLGKIPRESRLGRWSKKAKISFVKFSLIAFPLFFKPSRDVPIRTFWTTFVHRQRQTIKALHHWFEQLEAKNKQNWDTT